MIRYNLICSADHEFEGWFSSSKAYDEQAASGLLACPVCRTPKVEKAIMAPAVKTARKAAAQKDMQAKAAMTAVAAKIRREISKSCKNVGANFAEEARAMHYGEKPQCGIYGSTTPKESADLKEEGIDAHPLPDIFVPDTDKPKLN
jgi:hypothetical protein